MTVTVWMSGRPGLGPPLVIEDIIPDDVTLVDYLARLREIVERNDAWGAVVVHDGTVLRVVPRGTWGVLNERKQS